jgi:hypothetical protein
MVTSRRDDGLNAFTEDLVKTIGIIGAISNDRTRDQPGDEIGSGAISFCWLGQSQSVPAG